MSNPYIDPYQFTNPRMRDMAMEQNRLNGYGNYAPLKQSTNTSTPTNNIETTVINTKNTNLPYFNPNDFSNPRLKQTAIEQNKLNGYVEYSIRQPSPRRNSDSTTQSTNTFVTSNNTSTSNSNPNSSSNLSSVTCVGDYTVSAINAGSNGRYMPEIPAQHTLQIWTEMNRDVITGEYVEQFMFKDIDHNPPPDKYDD